MFRVQLHKCQYAHQIGKSTKAALVKLIDGIQDTLTNKETLVCVFVDIEGAFSNTTQEVIKEALFNREPDSVTSRWMS